MSAIATLMKMRAQVTRATSGTDSYGGQAAPLNPQPVADAMPIYVWIESDTEYLEGKSVAVERMKGYCRKDADIQRLDTIVQIVNRNGDVLFAGPIVVEAVTPKNLGAVISHLQLALRRVSGT